MELGLRRIDDELSLFGLSVSFLLNVPRHSVEWKRYCDLTANSCN